MLRKISGISRSASRYFSSSIFQSSHSYIENSDYKKLAEAIVKINEKYEALRDGEVIGAPLVITRPPANLSDEKMQYLESQIGRGFELLGLAMQKKGILSVQLSEVEKIAEEIDKIYQENKNEKIFRKNL